MKVLVIYAHPLPDSFNAGVHRAVIDSLQKAGHEVDDLDLYAENFSPVLTPQERRDYHDLSINRAHVSVYIARLMHAEAVVFVFPTWSFGVPAILKGWFDRVLIPGVSFTLGPDGAARPALTHIKRIVGVSTYGRPWWHVRLLVGDLPRKQITRYFRALTGFTAKADYVALYNMNQATPEKRAKFIERVRVAMKRL
jgi:NAD(P)H dehydrogenase (quinone)